MKLISSSLVAREYERNVLLAKLNCEYGCVDEFIFIESAYDTHGKPKGLFLEKILSHPDFSPFKDKITVLSNKDSFYPVGVEYSEKNNLQCEFNSRAYCQNYVYSKYNDDDFLFMEDADEMLDFSHPLRRDTLLNLFNKHNESIQIFSRRYWWDYTNLSIIEKYVPCHKIGSLKERERPFDNRNGHCKMIRPDILSSFEYSHCFVKSENWVKVTTSAHDKYTPEVMENAYRYNTWHRTPLRGEQLQFPTDFFETIELNENNSPKFVLENLDQLKVNTIDINYAKNRVQELGLRFPHPYEQVGWLGNNKIDRRYHYFRKSK